MKGEGWVKVIQAFFHLSLLNIHLVASITAICSTGLSEAVFRTIVLQFHRRGARNVLRNIDKPKTS